MCGPRLQTLSESLREKKKGLISRTAPEEGVLVLHHLQVLVTHFSSYDSQVAKLTQWMDRLNKDQLQLLQSTACSHC